MDDEATSRRLRGIRMTRLGVEAIQFEESCSVPLEVDVKSERTPAGKATREDFKQVASCVRWPVWAVLSAIALLVLVTATAYFAFTYLVAE